MQTNRKAKLFKNGSSLEVRLPAEFRFEGDEVYISRDEKTQNVILSAQPDAQAGKDFLEFMASRRPEDVPDDWMRNRPLNRIVFDEEQPPFSESV